MDTLINIALFVLFLAAMPALVFLSVVLIALFIRWCVMVVEFFEGLLGG